MLPSEKLLKKDPKYYNKKIKLLDKITALNKTAHVFTEQQLLNMTTKQLSGAMSEIVRRTKK